MRISLMAFGLVAVVAASPFPTVVNEATPANATTTPDGDHNEHKEPTPTFRLSCVCAQPIIPVDKLSLSEKCEMKYAFEMGCYYRAQGGCASPALAC